MSLSVNANISSLPYVPAANHTAERVRADRKPTEKPAADEVQGIRVSAEAISLLDKQRSQVNTERFHQRAIDVYQSVQHDQRRAEVQSMLGVDLYA